MSDVETLEWFYAHTYGAFVVAVAVPVIVLILLSVIVVGTGPGHLILFDTEMFGQLALQANAVKGSQGGHLRRFQTGVKQ